MKGRALDRVTFEHARAADPQAFEQLLRDARNFDERQLRQAMILVFVAESGFSLDKAEALVADFFSRVKARRLH